jgi:hypothetical protein
VSDTGAPAPGGPAPFRAIISVIESALFACALIVAGFKGWHLNPVTTGTLLGGFTAHAINHPAGGSPI